MSAIASPRARRSGRPWCSWRGRDAVVALGVLAIQVGATHAAARHQPDRAALDAWGYALLAAGPAALLFRRRWPLQVLGFVFAATLAYWLLDYPRGPNFVALIVAFVTVAMRGYRWVAWGTLAVGYVGFLGLGALTGVDEPRLGDAIGLAAWLLALAAVTELVRSRRLRAREARRTRRQESLRRVGEERLRIARELHDVLAHNVSLINVQAGVALHLLQKGDGGATDVEPALTAIKQASAETLREMRSVLGTLRQADEEAPRAPEPGLADLGALVGRMRDAGVAVDLTVTGERRDLPGSVDLAAYRIVQEALTNVARHAPGQPARVQVAFDDAGLTIAVANPTAAGPAGDPEPGNGIVGMRERASALGGTLEARRGADGVFTVRARLPVEAGR
ncbi:MAG TPA: histidine kinase [Solirubrobacterales bacterium]|nr:histidine kinase [Solirubrobacterales bacterium]